MAVLLCLIICMGCIGVVLSVVHRLHDESNATASSLKHLREALFTIDEQVYRLKSVAVDVERLTKQVDATTLSVGSMASRIDALECFCSPYPVPPPRDVFTDPKPFNVTKIQEAYSSVGTKPLDNEKKGKP